MLKKFLPVSAIVFVAVLTVSSQRSLGGEGYVGSEICKECHEESYDSYMKNNHAIKGDPRTPAAQHGCESCHGPGAVHAEEGEGGGIISLGPRTATPAEKKNEVCLACHTKSKLALWHGSTHEDRGLSCSECHTIHDENCETGTGSSRTEVCIKCHKRLRAELLRQSHHPIREGKMTCVDCHNPHGTIADNLVDAQYSNLKCFECHAELRGPFLWEHPPVVEDCLTCHTPHGSSRSKLLKAKMPYVCQRCHASSGHPGTLYARRSSQAGQTVYLALNSRAFYRSCLNCHSRIHGSNHPSGKSLLR